MTEIIRYSDDLMTEKYPHSPDVVMTNVVKLDTFRQGNVHLMIGYRRMYSPFHSSGHVSGSFDVEDFTFNMATVTILYKILSNSEKIKEDTLQKQMLIRIWRDSLLEDVITSNDDLKLYLHEMKGFVECRIEWCYKEDQIVDSMDSLIKLSGKIKDFLIDSIDGDTLDFDVLSSGDNEGSV